MKKLFILSAIVGFTIAGCKDSQLVDLPQCPPPEGTVTGEKPGENVEPDNPSTTSSFINCSYIRGDFYETGKVSKESMEACNDLIYLSASVCSEGHIMFDIPKCDGKLENEAVYVNSHEGRNGVIQFKGGNSRFNAGTGLLESPNSNKTKSKEVSTFTFSTYVYLEEWNTQGPGYLFRKGSEGKQFFSFKTKTDNKLALTIDGTEIATFSPEYHGLKTGKWQYVALAFDGKNKKATLYVDDVKLEKELTKEYAVHFDPNNPHTDFCIGEGIKGYMDETAVNSQAIQGAKSPLNFNKTDWNSTKYTAYWKYDDSQNPGKDSHTWLTILESIRSKIGEQLGSRKRLRLGIKGSGESNNKGGWQYMVADETARTNFANNVKKLVNDYGFDGVDLDFEWFYNSETQGLSDYSATILKLRETLGKDAYLTVSLLPSAYKISQEAIAAVDFISLQCYGVNPDNWAFSFYENAAKEITQYGVPKNKLVMGVPFYGCKGKGQSVAYRDLVEGGCIVDPSQNTVAYNGIDYTIDSQDRMREKVRYVIDNEMLGIMSWDLATDVPVTDEKSLLKVVCDEFKYADFTE